MRGERSLYHLGRRHAVDRWFRAKHGSDGSTTGRCHGVGERDELRRHSFDTGTKGRRGNRIAPGAGIMLRGAVEVGLKR